MDNNGNIDIVLSRDSIVERAKKRWDSKLSSEKIRCGYKYKHAFEKLNLPKANWDVSFEELSRVQLNLLIKGELIRTYDSMSNKEKSKIKKCFGLSLFSSKWFRLPSCDKTILLNSLLKHEKGKK